ncbi:kinetochore component CENP-S-domain-containing protein [Parasitella parasitica]|nr:kinetochore component CENP-S-domain-containing protein [Parasitella parasitica]
MDMDMNFESQEEPVQEQDQKQQKLHAAVWHQVDQIVKEQARQLRKDASEAFVASLAEILMAQIQTMATDLEAFAIHGKRATISMEDVKLCSRRNDSLYQLISDAANEISKDSNSRKKK